MKKFSLLVYGILIFVCSIGLIIPQTVEGASIHAVLVGDVHDPNIGPGDRLDLNLIKGLLRDISRNTGMPLRMKVIDDRIDRSTVMSTVRNLNPGRDDMVLFYYTGHGYRMRSMQTKWPAMALKGPDDNTAGLDQYWVYNVLKRKNPRLLMVMTDACNNYVSEGAIDTQMSVQSSRERRESYKKLFRQHRGTIIASSSVPGQYSFSGSTGSQFTVAFLRNVRRALSQRNPSWNSIMRASARPLMNGRQRPQYAMNDRGSSHFSDSGDTEQVTEEDREDERETVPGNVSGEGAALFAQLLIQLETSVKYSAQSSGWRGQRSAWVRNVRSAGNSGNLSRLRDLLITFETNIKYNAQTSSWPNRRSQWINRVRSAGGLRALIQPLLDVEASIKYSGQSSSWRNRRSGWMRQVRGITADSDRSSGAGNSFGNFLLELEASVKYSAQSSSWRSRRSGWMRDVRNAGGNVSRLRELLLTFETNIKYSAQNSSWRNRRSSWVRRVRSADSISDLKTLLIQVESSIKYSAQSNSWRQRRSGWLQKVRRL